MTGFKIYFQKVRSLDLMYEGISNFSGLIALGFPIIGFAYDKYVFHKTKLELQADIHICFVIPLVSLVFEYSLLKSKS